MSCTVTIDRSRKFVYFFVGLSVFLCGFSFGKSIHYPCPLDISYNFCSYSSTSCNSTTLRSHDIVLVTRFYGRTLRSTNHIQYQNNVPMRAYLPFKWMLIHLYRCHDWMNVKKLNTYILFSSQLGLDCCWILYWFSIVIAFCERVNVVNKYMHIKKSEI